MKTNKKSVVELEEVLKHLLHWGYTGTIEYFEKVLWIEFDLLASMGDIGRMLDNIHSKYPHSVVKYQDLLIYPSTAIYKGSQGIPLGPLPKELRCERLYSIHNNDWVVQLIDPKGGSKPVKFYDGRVRSNKIKERYKEYIWDTFGKDPKCYINIHIWRFSTWKKRAPIST